MNILDSIWNWILKFFNASEKAIVAGFQAGINNVIQEIGVDGWKIVQDAVAAAESVTGTGQDKFDAAWNTITTDFKNLGLGFAVNTVKLAIEAAVAQLRAAQVSIPPTPTP